MEKCNTSRGECNRKVTKHVQTYDNHKHGDNMENDEDQGVEYVGRSDTFALEDDWNSSDYDSLFSDEDEECAENKNFHVYKHKPGGPQNGANVKFDIL